MQLPAEWMNAKSRLQELLSNVCSKCGLFAAFQIHVKRGDHMKGARMLIRVANNISKFPSRKYWQQRSCALQGNSLISIARFILPQWSCGQQQSALHSALHPPPGSSSIHSLQGGILTSPLICPHITAVLSNCNKSGLCVMNWLVLGLYHRILIYLFKKIFLENVD